MRSQRHLRLLVVGLLGLASGARSAMAADLLPPPPPGAEVAPIPVASGWYLRGDATVGSFDRPADATRPNPDDPGMPPLVGLRLSREAGYGGGVGYQVNDWLRVDATFDQRVPSRFGTYSSRSDFTTGYNIEAGKLATLTGLFNVYADLGTWWGLTPYIGGGLGFAQNEFRRGYTQTTCILDACDQQPGTGPRTAVARPNHGLTAFAWALTAGVSYEIAPGLSLDVAYRRVDFGSAKSGIDDYGGSTRLKDLTANEARVGLRYRFADGLLPLPSGNPYGN